MGLFESKVYVIGRKPWRRNAKQVLFFPGLPPFPPSLLGDSNTMRSISIKRNKVNFKRICEETSLHGAKFIFFKKSWVVASFWIFVMLTMFALAGIIIRVYVVGNKYAF